MDRRHARWRRHADPQRCADPGQRQHGHAERHAVDPHKCFRQQPYRQQQRSQRPAEQWRTAAERGRCVADAGNRKQQQHALPLPEHRYRQPLRQSRHLDEDRRGHARPRLQRRSAVRPARRADRPAGIAEPQWRGSAERRTAACRGRHARHPRGHDDTCRRGQHDRSRQPLAERRHTESGRRRNHRIDTDPQRRHAAGYRRQYDQRPL